MKLKQYQVDAFATRAFEGNPAAVCPLESWLDDGLLQAIAEENNLSETAFFVPSETGYQLRWFTPVKEVDLCGHATLAAAHILFEKLAYAQSAITFETRSGDLFVRRNGQKIEMDFPASLLKPCAIPAMLVEGLGVRPLEVWTAEDYMAVFDSEATIRAITPNPALLSQLDLRGVIITAPASKIGDSNRNSAEVDFVSRMFAPKYGIPEDPVTGSAHCALAPYWATRLGKTRLNARQVSRRGGTLTCEVNADRVILSGHAVTFMEAEITF
ncbi:MAG: PhzF family phenazine biosynthesis protein [Thiobacillus sp.]